MKDSVPVFAVLRLDLFLPEDVPDELRVTVKEIVGSAAEAEAEVQRLSGLVDDDRVKYFWQKTRSLVKSAP